MKPFCQRHKRLKREGRLQAAKYWLPKYNGKNIVKGYSKHFGVNIICAVDETFYFIAGYTSIDVSYRLSWEEMEHDNEALNGHCYSEELPF